MNRNVLHFARTMRRQPTAAENLLWDSLRNEKLDGHVFRRQHPIGLHILDFYCHAARLCIEIDGGIHQQEDQKAYDQERQEFLTKEKGIRVLRLTNEDILHALSDALDRIRVSLRSSPLPSGEGSGEREGGEEGLGVEQNAPVILTLRVPSNLLPFVIPKGSITIDGVALTIASVDGDLCSIALIPHTLALTTLGSLHDGDRVNIETDVLLRWLAHAHKRD
jgi:very-short-patch-repair endonuclease